MQQSDLGRLVVITHAAKREADQQVRDTALRVTRLRGDLAVAEQAEEQARRVAADAQAFMCDVWAEYRGVLQSATIGA